MTGCIRSGWNRMDFWISGNSRFKMRPRFSCWLFKWKSVLKFRLIIISRAPVKLLANVHVNCQLAPSSAAHSEQNEKIVLQKRFFITNITYYNSLLPTSLL